MLAKQLELRWASATVASSAVPADSAVSSSDQDGILLEDAISGLPTGVYQQPSGNFTSQVWFASKLRCIGTFDSPEKASAAYVAVKADLAGVKQSANSAGKMNAAFDKAKKKAVEAVEATSEGGLPTGVTRHRPESLQHKSNPRLCGATSLATLVFMILPKKPPPPICR